MTSCLAHPRIAGHASWSMPAPLPPSLRVRPVWRLWRWLRGIGRSDPAGGLRSGVQRGCKGLFACHGGVTPQTDACGLAIGHDAASPCTHERAVGLLADTGAQPFDGGVGDFDWFVDRYILDGLGDQRGF